MSNERVKLHLARSKYFLSELKRETGKGLVKIERQIRVNVFDKHFPQKNAPSLETIRSYFLSRRAIPYESADKEIPSWLLAVEMEFPGSSRNFFHPFWNITLGPLPSKEKIVDKMRLYPIEWIEKFREDGDLKSAMEAEDGNAKLMMVRNRRQPWVPADRLSWIHSCILHLTSDVKEILMSRDGLSYQWKRRYLCVEAEIAALTGIENLESLTAALALMLEGAHIGDNQRLILAKKFLISELLLVEKKEQFKCVCNEIRRLVTWHIERIYVRSYAPLSTELEAYPESWRPLVYNYILDKKSNMKFNQDEE
jgi:hypothetical protein